VEVHLLDFHEDIYDQPIRVNFVQRLRGEQKFAGPEALAGQIKRDVETARKLLSSELA
jgi:riboflavin kinase/FMN adenylyltransferase